MKRAIGAFLGVTLAACLVIVTLLEPGELRGAVASDAPALVYVGPHDKKYHGQECRGLTRTSGAGLSSLSRADAEAKGFNACRQCFPR